MSQMQLLRVKTLTANAILVQHLKSCFIATVNLVTEKRMPKICHMHSDLVRSTRFKHALNVIKSVKSFDNSIMRYRLTRGIRLIFDDRHLLSIDGMTSNRLINRALKLFEVSKYDCVVDAAHFVSFELLGK